MSPDPEVSIVMGVYNGRDSLVPTIASVLAQEGVSFELVIVDDGCTDGSSIILKSYSKLDSRVRVLEQSNLGLTRALIAGCRVARGRFIARQDCGDTSSPWRLVKLVRQLEQDPYAVMVTCGTRFRGPAGEELFTVVQNSDALMRGLSAQSPQNLRGPSHHGSTMFRRDAYERVGGYRPEFHVAQDLDLWTRLAETGRCLAIKDTLYEARLEAGSISASKRDEQMEATRVIAECAKQRRQGESDRTVLDRWLQARGRKGPVRRSSKASTDARFYHFIGSLLQHRDPIVARRYFRRALEASPFHVRSMVKLLLGTFASRWAGLGAPTRTF